MNSPKSIYINSATVRLLINEDESRVIEFNPEDLSFIEAFYDLIKEFDKKMAEFKGKEIALEKDKTVDKYGIPNNTAKRIALTRSVCTYLRNKVDALFGAGTSDTVFGKTNTLDMFSQFFEGITPYIEVSRTKKVEKYLSDGKGDVME